MEAEIAPSLPWGPNQPSNSLPSFIHRSPCVPPGTTIEYSYGDKHYNAIRSSDATSGACLDLARRVIEQADSSFQQAPKQPAITHDQQVFAMSYYFDRAIDIGA
jgi:hypothetical protein